MTPNPALAAAPAVDAPLTEDGLRSLVEGLSAAPGLWAERVRHDPR